MEILKLPRDYSELTLQEAMVYYSGVGLRSTLAAVTKKTLAEIDEMPSKVVEAAEAHLQSVFAAPMAMFAPRVKIDGRWHGFIPDWEKITVGEWADLEHYCKEEPWESADAVLSILFRPIIEEDLKQGTYSIAAYGDCGTERRHQFLDASAALYEGAVVFFWATVERCMKDGLCSLGNQAKKMMYTVSRRQSRPILAKYLAKNGAGSARS